MTSRELQASSKTGLEPQTSIKQHKHVVLVLIDGLGWWNLQEYLGHAPNLRRVIKQAPHENNVTQPGPQGTVNNSNAPRCTARSTFPSTTAAAITSLLTGLAPGAHNMLSYQVYDPQLDKRFNLINFEGFPREIEDFQDQPTWFELLEQCEEKTFALGPKKFVGGGLTQAALRGAEYVSAEKLDERAHKAAQLSGEAALTYLYMAEVDHAGHSYGVGDETWLEALEAVDRSVGVLLGEISSNTEVIITSDHGMLNVSPTGTCDLGQLAVAQHITQAAGEGRVLHLRVSPGQATRVQESLTESLRQYSPNTLVLTREETLQLFADYNGVTVRRPELIGDLVVVSGDDTQTLDSRFYKPQTFQMKGVHGGLSEIEMRAPLLRYAP